MFNSTSILKRNFKHFNTLDFIDSDYQLTKSNSKLNFGVINNESHVPEEYILFFHNDRFFYTNKYLKTNKCLENRRIRNLRNILDNENELTKNNRIYEKTSYEIIVDAEIEELEKVLNFIDEGLGSFKPNDIFKLELNLVIEEIFSNIVKYGYLDWKKTGDQTNDFEDQKINISFKVKENPLTVVTKFTDNGCIFNPLVKDLDDQGAFASEK